MKKHVRKGLTLVALVGVSLSLQSCATMFGDNQRTVCVHSQPEGAAIYVDGQRRGTTPATITLPTYIYGGKSVVVKKEGVSEQTMNVQTRFQPCGLWNILFWPGFLVDAAVGNTVKIDPANLNLFAELTPMTSEK